MCQNIIVVDFISISLFLSQSNIRIKDLCSQFREKTDPGLILLLLFIISWLLLTANFKEGLKAWKLKILFDVVSLWKEYR